MTDPSCEPFADLLVAYSDGELPAAEAERVARHVAECAACRSELRLLERSLELARQVWHQSAARAPAPGTRAKRAAGRRIVAACAAACGILLAATMGYRVFSRGQPESETARTTSGRPVAQRGGVRGPAEQAEVPPKAGPEPMDDVEAVIAREARAARLAVAVEFLGSQPELREYRDQAEGYLRETYGVVRSVGPDRSSVPN